MTVLLNPNFHDPGPTPGAAAHWTIASSCSAARIAAFGPTPVTGTEDFERWWSLSIAFVDGALVLAFFDPIPRGVEAFEGWNGGAFLGGLTDAIVDVGVFDGGSAESFGGWLSGPWSTRWADVTTDVAMFGGAALDNFEAWWVLPTRTWESATFDGGVTTFDSFAGVWPAARTL
ncbi:MAG: hypothetical protein ACHREM_13960 [Polyangiales bacterium]